MSLMRRFPRQVNAAPTLWNRPNSGNPIPGPKIVGLNRVSGHQNILSGLRMGRYQPAIGSTGDRALAKVEETEARKRMEEGKQKQRVSRKKYEAMVRFSLNVEGLMKTAKSYEATHVPIHRHYAPRGLHNGFANKSMLTDLLNSGREQTRSKFMPFHHNRRVNPEITGKNQIAIEEGEQKYGWKSERSDPFLREGPRTQLSHKINVDGSGGDFNYFRPAGVPKSLASWYHQRQRVRQQTYDHIKKRMRGDRMFYYQFGPRALSYRANQLMKWYTDLVNTPVPRITMSTRNNPYSGMYARRAKHAQDKPSVATASHHDRRGYGHQDLPGARVPFGGNIDPRYVRLERPEYSVAA